MEKNVTAKILDITENDEYQRYLYKCLSPIPFRKYKKRHNYLEAAIPKGFHKKLLVFGGEVAGEIEYSPEEVSGYPITGKNIIVMNCIWVLRKAKGHNFGKQLLTDMIKSEKKASGFATIALEKGEYWRGWLKKEHMEKLGFKSIDSIKVKHKTKHKGQCFKIHLMWLPTTKDANPPKWDAKKLLEGVDFCLAHPLYHPESIKCKEILEKC